jgi:hypothetical protein
MALLANYKSETGSGVIIKADGTQVGFAQGVTAQEDYQAEQVYVIGDIMPQENLNHRFSLRLTLDHVKLRLDELVQGDIVKIAEDVLQKADFNIEVIDLDSAITKVVWEGCVLDSRNHTIRANTLSAAQATFLALRVSELV